MFLPFNSVIPLAGIYPKETIIKHGQKLMHKDVPQSIIYNNENCKQTQITTREA